MTNQKSFIFDTELHLVVVTGIKARSLRELRTELARISESSVFLHMHQEYLAHDFQQTARCTAVGPWPRPASNHTTRRSLPM